MADAAETSAMHRAIALSTRDAYTTPPNPDVGCVVLDASGQVAGEGWHQRAGGPHAEVAALADAGERARGGTAVVTLEPCHHTGRTGPCTGALVSAGVARVVYAVADPNPVAAGGADWLRAHGVDVETGLLAAEADHANRRWLTPFRTGRPFVVWKYAASLDGRSAAADGTSRWISGSESRADVHRLRAAVDTIVAGVGTVLTDDPQLTARIEAPAPAAPGGSGARPVEDARTALRVVVDSHGRTPPDARVRDDAAPTWIATAADVGADAHGRVDLVALLARLHDDGKRYVLLEGGPQLAGAFLRAGLVDRVVGYLAPTLIGDGRAALSGAGVTTITEAVGLDVDDVSRFGPDIRITATPRT